MTMTVESGTKHGSGANPMEQFVLLAKGAKGLAASELVKQALEAPGLYVFSELMELSNIKELQSSDQKGVWNLLNIFAHGTFKEYEEKKVTLGLPELTPPQTKKLKHLTIVTLSEKEKCIAYALLQEELKIKEIRELEDLIIEAIYAEIIQGKLDQKRGVLEVDNAIGRDVREEDLPVIINTLESWSDACENVLASLQTQMDRASAERVHRIQRKEQLEQEIANLKKTIKVHPVDAEDMVADSREGASSERTPMKKTMKKGLRGSSKFFNNK